MRSQKRVSVSSGYINKFGSCILKLGSMLSRTCVSPRHDNPCLMSSSRAEISKGQMSKIMPSRKTRLKVHFCIQLHGYCLRTLAQCGAANDWLMLTLAALKEQIISRIV